MALSDHCTPEGGVLPPPTSFPEDIFPQKIKKALQQAALAFSVPFVVPAMAFLAAVGASIGRTLGLQVKSGWVVHPNLYCALVAQSGMGKSPCTKAIFKTLEMRDAEAFEVYQQELAEFRRKLALSKGQVGEEIFPPTLSQFYVDDCTTQAIGLILRDNPRGSLWYRDELSGFFADLGRYDGKGADTGDKSRLLSAYDCGSWKVSRRSKDDIFIRYACLSIFGTVQPEILPSLFKKIDISSGLLPRFIFARCQKVEPTLWSSECYDGEYSKIISDVLNKALDLQLDENGQACIIEVEPLASEAIENWFNAQSLKYWNTPELQQFRSLEPKLCSVCFKLALILHFIELQSVDSDFNIPLSLKVFENTVRLMDWVEREQWEVWLLLSPDTQLQQVSTLEERVANAILALSDKVKNTFLSTSQITSTLNEGVEPCFYLKSEAVGRACSKLGLERTKNSKARGIVINDEVLLHLKKYSGQ